jgi:hypothetical protein
MRSLPHAAVSGLLEEVVQFFCIDTSLFSLGRTYTELIEVPIINEVSLV